MMAANQVSRWLRTWRPQLKACWRSSWAENQVEPTQQIGDSPISLRNRPEPRVFVRFSSAVLLCSLGFLLQTSNIQREVDVNHSVFYCDVLDSRQWLQCTSHSASSWKTNPNKKLEVSPSRRSCTTCLSCRQKLLRWNSQWSKVLPAKMQKFCPYFIPMSLRHFQI